jgi:hypothetical protein
MQVIAFLVLDGVPSPGLLGVRPVILTACSNERLVKLHAELSAVGARTAQRGHSRNDSIFVTKLRDFRQIIS